MDTRAPCESGCLDRDNYERLRYPVDAVTRDARYSRYVSETHMLRSHITAMIPGLLDRLVVELPVDDVLLAPVGLVYRRDVTSPALTPANPSGVLWLLTEKAHE
jgi:phenylalanyl-tRNA synthetase alpha chain